MKFTNLSPLAQHSSVFLADDTQAPGISQSSQDRIGFTRVPKGFFQFSQAFRYPGQVPQGHRSFPTVTQGLENLKHLLM